MFKLHVFNFAYDVRVFPNRSYISNNCILAAIIIWIHFSWIKRPTCCAWQIGKKEKEKKRLTTTTSFMCFDFCLTNTPEGMAFQTSAQTTHVSR